MIYKPASVSPDFRPRRMALMLCGFLLVSTIFSPPGGADKPTNKALVTDKADLPLSDQFAPPGQIRSRSRSLAKLRPARAVEFTATFN